MIYGSRRITGTRPVGPPTLSMRRRRARWGQRLAPRWRSARAGGAHAAPRSAALDRQRSRRGEHTQRSGDQGRGPAAGDATRAAESPAGETGILGGILQAADASSAGNGALFRCTRRPARASRVGGLTTQRCIYQGDGTAAAGRRAAIWQRRLSCGAGGLGPIEWSFRAGKLSLGSGPLGIVQRLTFVCRLPDHFRALVEVLERGRQQRHRRRINAVVIAYVLKIH